MISKNEISNNKNAHSKYLNPLLGRIFGETAIGAIIAALFKIKIITFIK